MRYTYTRCLEPLMWGGAQSPGWLHIGSFVKFSITEPLPHPVRGDTGHPGKPQTLGPCAYN